MKVYMTIKVKNEKKSLNKFILYSVDVFVHKKFDLNLYCNIISPLYIFIPLFHF